MKSTLFLAAAAAVFLVSSVEARPRSAPAVPMWTFCEDVCPTKEVRRESRKTVAKKRVVVSYAAGPSTNLVNTARRYIGTNPTGRRSLWCGAFMSLVLERAGYRPGGNLARGYANYGRRLPGPQVGALAVMSRGKRGGHVGVISGIQPDGSLVVISGNHNNTTAESVYPRSRVIAYVDPAG